MLYDMHCHLGFLREGEGNEGGEGVTLAAGTCHGALPQNMYFLNATVKPEDFDAVQARFAGCENVFTAPGLHPWYVDARPEAARAQAEALCAHVRPGSLVGEIGLDFGPRHAQTRAEQVLAFDTAVAAAAREGGCVLSIHSVQATEAVLDTLDAHQFFSAGHAIFHWYSGSSAHLTRAIRAGAHFSINPHSLETRRGQEYARVIPLDRLLAETDFPAEDGTLPAPFAQTITGVLARVAEIRGMSTAELSAVVAENSWRLLFMR